MILRVIRALLGRSRRDAQAAAEADKNSVEHAAAMHAVWMKVDAMKTGADRMKEERRKTDDAAATMLARLQEDFPQ